MGAGKSTVALAISRRLSLPHRDTDEIVVGESGRSISEIFVEDGEDAFRALEKIALRVALLEDETILSLGGGAPLSQNAQDKIRSISSPVIFLDVSLATAAPRVGFNRDRPLLLSNPRAAWQELMDKRRPIYESLATQIVSVDGLSPKEVVAKIVEVVGESA